MESDHHVHQPTSDQKTIDRDDQGASVVVTTLARSYECNFCKRGFSNAQALGGHMNIHRKDKAKLKQQSSNQTHHQPSSLDIHHEMAMVPSLEDKSDHENWPWNVSQQHHVSSIDETLKQLPLFEESPTSSANQKLQGQVHEEIITQSALSSGQGSSSLELDLELRLGPEPAYTQDFVLDKNKVNLLPFHLQPFCTVDNNKLQKKCAPVARGVDNKSPVVTRKPFLTPADLITGN